MAEQAYTTDTHPQKRAQMPISDGQPSANGGTHQGPDPPPPPAAGPPLGGRASTPSNGRTLRLREEDAGATTPALTELAAVVTNGAPPADGGSPEATALTPATDSPKRAGAGADAAGAGAAAAAADRPMPTAAPPAPSGNKDRDADPIALAAPPVLPQRDPPAPRQGVASPAATDQPPAVTHLLAAQRKRGASQPPQSRAHNPPAPGAQPPRGRRTTPMIRPMITEQLVSCSAGSWPPMPSAVRPLQAVLSKTLQKF